MTVFPEISEMKSASSLDQFNKYLDHAQLRVSNWGARLISVEGLKGEMSLNVVAVKYFELINQFNLCQKDNLEERVKASEMWEKFKKLYEDSSKITSRNCWLSIMKKIDPDVLHNNYCSDDIESVFRDRNRVRYVYYFNLKALKNIWTVSSDEYKTGLLTDGTYISESIVKKKIYKLKMKQARQLKEKQYENPFRPINSFRC